MILSLIAVSSRATFTDGEYNEGKQFGCACSPSIFFPDGGAEVSPKLPVPYTLSAFYPTFQVRHELVLDLFYLSMNEIHSSTLAVPF